MSKKLKHAPVYFAIGQVQHNPLLNLSTYVPAIQERMRKAGYPDFKQSIQAQIDLAATPLGAPDADAGAQPAIRKVEQFLFLNAGCTSGFVLQANSISFQTTEYDTFETFLSDLRLGLGTLHEAAGGLDFVERLGLRYLDAVVPRERESLGQYLVNELLGLPASFRRQTSIAKFAYSFTEAVLVSEGVGQVVARSIIQNGPLGFPADLRPDPLTVPERFRKIAGEHAILDTDGSFSQRQSFDAGAIETRLKQLHDLIHMAFRASVTDHAIQAWDGENDK